MNFTKILKNTEKIVILNWRRNKNYYCFAW